jgi:hypothetical protein
MFEGPYFASDHILSIPAMEEQNNVLFHHRIWFPGGRTYALTRVEDAENSCIVISFEESMKWWELTRRAIQQCNENSLVHDGEESLPSLHTKIVDESCFF